MKFEIGDKVIMEGPQIYRGRECADVTPPVTGEIVSLHNRDGRSFYSVRWKHESGITGRNYMDEACLVAEEPSEEDLAEVYRILGNRTTGTTYCCESMEGHINKSCDEHDDPWDCPDAVIVKTKRGVGLPIRDGGRSYINVDFCPWCGKRVRS